MKTKDELATDRGNTRTIFTHTHKTGEGYQGGEDNQGGGRNHASGVGRESEKRGEVNTK